MCGGPYCAAAVAFEVLEVGSTVGGLKHDCEFDGFLFALSTKNEMCTAPKKKECNPNLRRREGKLENAPRKRKK